MTNPYIVRNRLISHRLEGRPFNKPEEVVRHFGAVQAQDYAAAKWALAQRMRNGSDAAIERAFNDGLILRTHVLRPTWHFVTPTDIRWMLELTAPRVRAVMASGNRKLELDDALFARSNDLIVKALDEGTHLTRRELKLVLEGAGIRTDVQRLAHIVMHCELDALICSGPRRGRQFTYALLENRAPKAVRLNRDEALAALALRYFKSHGPAQAIDFAWWSGLTLKEAREGIETVKSKLTEEFLEGKSYWHSTAHKAMKRIGSRAFLMSIYDEYTIAYKDRGALGEGAPFEKLFSFTMGSAQTSVLVIDGQVAGTWKRVYKKGRAEVTIKPFRRLSGDEMDSVGAEAQRYEAFLGMAVVVKRGNVG